MAPDETPVTAAGAPGGLSDTTGAGAPGGLGDTAGRGAGGPHAPEEPGVGAPGGLGDTAGRGAGGPHAPEEPGVGAPGGLDDEERQARLSALTELLDLVRPAVQADGGDLILVDADVESGRVEVQLQGSCSSCAISATTLQAGVSRILQDRLPWVTEVVGGVDDSLDWETSAAMGRGGYVPGY